MNSIFKALIFSTDLINKNMFQVSNKNTQKTHEFGSKFNVNNILVESKLVYLC